MESGTVEAGWDDAVRQINDCEYLFAQSIREIEELTLEVIITEAKAQAKIRIPRDNTEVEQLLAGSHPIETDSTCRVFRLIFERRHMVSYTVLNESYGTYPEPPEQFIGKLFRTFSRSHLLDFTKQTTCASDEYPGGVLQSLRDRMPQSRDRRDLHRATESNCHYRELHHCKTKLIAGEIRPYRKPEVEGQYPSGLVRSAVRAPVFCVLRRGKACRLSPHPFAR
jgi:hypothetical protein